MGFHLTLVNPYLIKQMPGRKSDVKFKEKFSRLAMRKPRKKALVAIARKLLVVIWNVLRYACEYNPQLVHIYDPVKMKARMAYYKKEYEKTADLLNIPI